MWSVKPLWSRASSDERGSRRAKNFVELELRSENSKGVLTVAPGPVIATLPSRASAPLGRRIFK